MIQAFNNDIVTQKECISFEVLLYRRLWFQESEWKNKVWCGIL